MRRYQVKEPITLHAGVIGLTKEQAGPRLRYLHKRDKGGGFDITGQVQFCAGEIIRLEPDQIQPVAHAVELLP